MILGLPIFRRDIFLVLHNATGEANILTSTHGEAQNAGVYRHRCTSKEATSENTTSDDSNARSGVDGANKAGPRGYRRRGAHDPVDMASLGSINENDVRVGGRVESRASNEDKDSIGITPGVKCEGSSDSNGAGGEVHSSILGLATNVTADGNATKLGKTTVVRRDHILSKLAGCSGIEVFNAVDDRKWASVRRTSRRIRADITSHRGWSTSKSVTRASEDGIVLEVTGEKSGFRKHRTKGARWHWGRRRRRRTSGR